MAEAVTAHWRLVDRMLAVYGLFVVVVGLTRITQPGVPWIVVAHLGLPLLAWASTRVSDCPTGRFLRAAYPAIIITGLYSAIDVLNGFGAVRVWDAPLQQIEAAIFGGMQPARDWWRAYPSAFWSTLFHAVYFSYYLIVPLPIIVFLIQRRTAAITQYLDGLISTYVCCYVLYMLVPVSGPYYQFARPEGAFVANLPAQWVYRLLAVGSSFGAAFPSSHVAATVAASIGAWFGSRRLGLMLAIPTALLVVGVVYCQMHYVVDSLAGVLLGVAVPLAIRRKKIDAEAP